MPGDLVDEAGVRVIRVKRSSQLVVALRMLVALVSLSSRDTATIVHATTWRVATVAQLVFRRSAHVVTVHGREVLNCNRVARSVLSLVLRRASVVLTVSEATREALEGVLPGLLENKVAVAWNGISFEREARAMKVTTRLADGPVRILCLARMVPRKNIDKAISAVAALHRSGHEVALSIGGRGPELTRLVALADAQLPPGVCRFLGFVEDRELPVLYREHDVFLHPHSHVGQGNDFEGFGIVIADAMSFGCAVVVGQDGGPRDYIVHGSTGWLVDGDDAASVADVLEAVVADRAVAAEVGQRGREVALEKMSWNAHAEVVLHRLLRSP